MTPPSQRLAAPEIDSVAFTTTIAAYQRTRRLIIDRPGDIGNDASLDVMHETRIARARLRHVIAAFVADSQQADIPKSSVVRCVNHQVNALVRSGTIDPDASLVSEVVSWIVEGYPDDLAAERAARGRPTPARGRDVIPIPLVSSAERVG